MAPTMDLVNPVPVRCMTVLTPQEHQTYQDLVQVLSPDWFNNGPALGSGNGFSTGMKVLQEYEYHTHANFQHLLETGFRIMKFMLETHGLECPEYEMRYETRTMNNEQV